MNRQAVWVFVICLGVYLSNGRPLPEVDCIAAPYVAWTLSHSGTYNLRECSELEKHIGNADYISARPNGRWVSMRPPGSAIAMIPLMGPIALFRSQAPNDLDMQQLGKLSAAVCVASAAVLLFLICQRLTPRAAWPATMLFGLGTCAYSVASQASWMHGPALLGLMAGLYCQIRSEVISPRWQYLSGLALGFAVLTRPTTAFFVLATMLMLIIQRRWRDVIWLALGGVIPAIVLFHYNWVNFGSPFLGGYQNDNWGESPPLWIGLGGLLIAPSRGMFIYSPALILLFPGLWIALTRKDINRWLVGLWSLAGLFTLLFFARWHDWRGGWCFGPRFLIEAMPIACLLFAFAYEALSQRWQRIAAWVLVGFSIAIHAIGVFGHRGYVEWQKRHDVSNRHDQGECLFEWHDTQIEAHVRGLLEQVLE